MILFLNLTRASSLQPKDFRAIRDADQKICKRTIFKSKLPSGMRKKGTTFSTVCGRASISWNNKLRNTAGRCRMAIERLKSSDVTINSKRKFMIELAPHILGLFSRVIWNRFPAVYECLKLCQVKIGLRRLEPIIEFKPFRKPYKIEAND